ncbi:MAG TPA: flavin reductase family protein [Acidimicrobiales bacterium]|nr:flavin reductase family protein [Acidimicrobiales bacterium]
MDDAEAFGALSAALDYPMFVVTAAAGEERAGCLVGFATQCSLDPVRFVVFLSRQNRTCRVAQRTDVLAVHLLRADQEPLAELFGAHTGDDVDKFARCRSTPGFEGVPLLDDCPNRLVGRVLEKVDGGDHLGFLLDVVEARASDPGAPLMFQQVRDLEPGHPA